MPRVVPHPYDVALAFLVRHAISDKLLARWLATICLADPPLETLGELETVYLKYLEDENEKLGIMVDMEVMQKLQDDLQEALRSPSALEIILEDLNMMVRDPENATREDYELFMAEEKFGLLIRNVTRLTLGGNFEDLCRLYERLGSFLNNEEQNEADTTIMESGPRRSRVSTSSRARISDTYHSRMDISGIVISPSKTITSSTSGAARITNFLKNPDEFRAGINKLETRATIEGLHLYYDHASRTMTKLLPPNHVFAESLRTEGHPNRKAVFMQHAVLELASLHYALGNEHEAFLAAREAVSVSQQNLDDSTLEQSLGLCRKLDEEVRRTSFVPNVTEATRLERVRDALQKPIARRPKVILKDLDEVVGKQYDTQKNLLRSDAWEQFGHAPLALVWTKRVASDATAPIEDRTIALCRMALAWAAKGKEVLKGSNLEQLNIANAMQLAEYALLLLKDAEQVVHQRVVRACVDATFELVHQNLLDVADFAAAGRVRNLHTAIGGQQNERMEIGALIAMGSTSDAFARSDALFAQQTNAVRQVDELLKLSRLFRKERALVLALKAWATARDLQLRGLCAVALMQAARARFESGNPQQALHLLEKALPHIFVHASKKDLREAQILEIKCRLKASKDASDFTKRLERFVRDMREDKDDPATMPFLQEAFYLLALGYDQLGKVKERDRAAEAFMAIESGRAMGDSRSIEALAMRTVSFAISMCAPGREEEVH